MGGAVAIRAAAVLLDRVRTGQAARRVAIGAGLRDAGRDRARVNGVALRAAGRELPVIFALLRTMAGRALRGIGRAAFVWRVTSQAVAM